MMTTKSKVKSATAKRRTKGEVVVKTKMQIAADKAIATGKMANTLAKALGRRARNRWKFLDFTSDGKKRESAGIVDIIAIRKSGKTPAVEGLKSLDLFDIILIQVKGGSAPRPTREDVKRLEKVAEYYGAEKIALFEWKKGKSAGFLEPNGLGEWVTITESKLFRK